MAITTTSNIGYFPVGARAILSDPSGVWGGEANVTGDLSGPPLSHSFMIPVGDELRVVLVIDWISFVTDTTVDTGALEVQITHHHELANVALNNDRFIAIDQRAATTNVSFLSRDAPTEWLRAFPIWWRRDLGGTPAERSFVSIGASINNSGQVYQMRAGGRYYDARILASREFWSLFAPAPRALA